MSLDVQPLLEMAEGLHYLSMPGAEKAVSLYPYVIEYLTTFDRSEVREMADTLWELIVKNVVMVVPTSTNNMTFVVNEFEGLIHEASILLPTNWVELFREDPIFQIGGTLYTGSQAIDFYNGRLIGQKEEATLRSQAYESEILYQTQLEIPEYVFQPYQQIILDKFPLGLTSEGVRPLLYRSAVVEVVEA